MKDCRAEVQVLPLLMLALMQHYTIIYTDKPKSELSELAASIFKVT